MSYAVIQSHMCALYQIDVYMSLQISDHSETSATYLDRFYQGLYSCNVSGFPVLIDLQHSVFL